MEDQRKIVRGLASHGVIEFEQGLKRERDLLNKESDIRSQNAHNKLQLISHARELLLWESAMTATSRTGTHSKRPAVKAKPQPDDRDRLEKLHKLLEGLKTTLQQQKEWVHEVWDKG